MRMTADRLAILEILEPGSDVRKAAGYDDGPLDVHQVAFILRGLEFAKDSTKRAMRNTLNRMVDLGLLERVSSYERRHNKWAGSSTAPGVRCYVYRYGIPGKIPVIQKHDSHERDTYVDAEFVVTCTEESPLNNNEGSHV